MSVDERKELLNEAVFIIQNHSLLTADPQYADWTWFFRGFIQWHWIAIVVAELGWSTNRAFSDAVWPLVEPMLQTWDASYRTKRDVPAWDHVNDLIERARQLRARQLAEHPNPESSTLPLRPPTAASLSARPPSWTDNPATPALMSDAESTQDLPLQPLQAPWGELGNIRDNGVPMALDYDFDAAAPDGLEDVDFGAFDQVFASGDWDFLDQMQPHPAFPFG